MQDLLAPGDGLGTLDTETALLWLDVPLTEGPLLPGGSFSIGDTRVEEGALALTGSDPDPGHLLVRVVPEPGTGLLPGLGPAGSAARRPRS